MQWLLLKSWYLYLKYSKSMACSLHERRQKILSTLCYANDGRNGGRQKERWCKWKLINCVLTRGSQQWRHQVHVAFDQWFLVAIIHCTDERRNQIIHVFCACSRIWHDSDLHHSISTMSQIFPVANKCIKVYSFFFSVKAASFALNLLVMRRYESTKPISGMKK